MKNACGNPTWFRRRFLGVQTFMRVVDGCLTTEQPTRYPLLEQILSPANLNTAYRQVMRNKGAAGKQTRTLSRVRVTQSSS